MEAEENILGFLVALGIETTWTVKELTEGDAVAVYEGEIGMENDTKVKDRYEKSVEACRVWLRAVIGAEVISNRSDDISAEAELIMPDRLLEAAVYSAEFPFGGGCN